MFAERGLRGRTLRASGAGALGPAGFHGVHRGTAGASGDCGLGGWDAAVSVASVTVHTRTTPGVWGSRWPKRAGGLPGARGWGQGPASGEGQALGWMRTGPRGPQRSFGTRFPAEAHMPGRPLTLGWFLRSSASQMFICKAGHGNADRKAPLRHDSAKTGSADLVKIWGRVSGAGEQLRQGPAGQQLS